MTSWQQRVSTAREAARRPLVALGLAITAILFLPWLVEERWLSAEPGVIRGVTVLLAPLFLLADVPLPIFRMALATIDAAGPGLTLFACARSLLGKTVHPRLWTNAGALNVLIFAIGLVAAATSASHSVGFGGYLFGAASIALLVLSRRRKPAVPAADGTVQTPSAQADADQASPPVPPIAIPSRLRGPRGWAAACLSVLLIGFIVGRTIERTPTATHSAPAAPVASTTPPAAQQEVNPLAAFFVGILALGLAERQAREEQFAADASQGAAPPCGQDFGVTPAKRPCGRLWHPPGEWPKDLWCYSVFQDEGPAATWCTDGSGVWEREGTFDPCNGVEGWCG